METKISMKTIYLLLVISIGLISLAVGSTFAVFTASAEIDNPISFTSNLSYTDNIFQTIDVTIPANSSEAVNFDIYNNSNINKDINYTTWYIYDGNDSNITFTEGTGNDGDVSSSPTGTISADSEGLGVYLTITNNTSSDITLTMGVATNTEDIVLPNYMKIVSWNSSTPTSYDLTLTKSTGIQTIYYKINGASDYSSTDSSTTISVPAGSTYYYYVVPSEGYTISSCTESNPCQETMSTSAVTKTLDATINSYNLTLTSTGVATIYYKVNGASSYSSTTDDSITLSVEYGTTYYYYGTASTGYSMDSCSSLSNSCSGTMGASSVTKTLSATQGYTVTIVRSAASTITTLKTSTVTARQLFTYDFSSSYTPTLNGTTYTYNRVSCTNSQVATVSNKTISLSSERIVIDTNDKTLKIASLTADTTCTLYYTSSSSSGGGLTS